MAKRKRSKAEFHLPEAILQHIQSFLNGKEAAQTTILSKSWYAAWLTRPNLDFDRKHFVRRMYDMTYNPAIKFWDFVKKTVDRYEKLNLKIDSFSFRLSNDVMSSYDPVNNQWIMKALKMGATDIDLDLHMNRPFALPQQVFGSENLIRLSLDGVGNIDIGADGKVSCWRLKSLTLRDVYVEGDTIRDIISSCPLIENLELSPWNRILLSPFTRFGRPFNKLKCLLLYKIDVDALFFDDLSSKFPCLKNLSVHDCRGYKGIHISSPSLECISFIQKKMLRVLKFDVPSIRKFVFSGTSIPYHLKLRQVRNWVSDISISCSRAPSATWFLRLNKLLTKLSPSKVSLSLRMRVWKILACAQDIKGLPKPQVENLTIDRPPICPALFNRLFRCCRPIYILQHKNDYYGTSNCDFMKFVYMNMMEKVSLKCSSASQSRAGECDLEGVDAEYFDKAISAWCPRSSDASKSPGADQQTIRLHLRWMH